MSNRISLLALVENKSALISHAQQRIAESTLSYFPDAGNFKIYSGQKEMFRGLSEAFSNSEVVIAAVENPFYLSFKKYLSQALNLENENNSDILDIISKSEGEVTASLTLAHAVVPKGSAVFFSEDGFFTGFAKKSGKQHLIVLPLDPGRIDGILDNGFLSYLNQITASSQSAVKTSCGKDPANISLDVLQTAGYSVAVASTKSAVFIKNHLNNFPGSEKTFIFVPCDEEKCATSQKEYIAGLAKKAREINSNTLGAAISNVFTSEKNGGRMFVFVTVADSVRARVAKVFGEPGETPRQLVQAAVDTLFNMLGDYAKSGNFEGYPAQESEENPPSSETKTKKSLAVWIILSVIAALLICITMIFFAGRAATANKNNAKDAETEDIHIISQISEDAVSYSSNSIIPAYILKNNISSSPAAASPGVVTTSFNTTILSSVLTSARVSAPTTADKSNSTTVSAASHTVAATSLPVTSTKIPATTAGPPVTTTKSPTTTICPPITTTIPVTTTNTPVTTTEPAITLPQSTGTFTFKVKGYGHGVGMSQEGAVAYAKIGWSYDQILLHYYHHNLLVLENDSAKPDSVVYGGESIPLGKYLAGTTAAEIGASAPLEALKAQVVAVYTYAKSNGFQLNSGQHSYLSDFDFDKNSNVKTAVLSVAGKYLAYNGSVASAPYFAESAGQTASAYSVWGSDKYPYLCGGIESPEDVSVTTESFTSGQIKDLVAKYNNKSISKNDITLSGEPSGWIKIISSDSAGYVEKIKVGDQVVTGNTFRYYILELGIRSHSFTVTYSAD